MTYAFAEKTSDFRSLRSFVISYLASSTDINLFFDCLFNRIENEGISV